MLYELSCRAFYTCFKDALVARFGCRAQMLGEDGEALPAVSQYLRGQPSNTPARSMHEDSVPQKSW